MVVLRNLLGDTLPIRRGTIITAINDIKADVFIEQMKQYASTDGFSDGFKENQISASFPARFRWLYGLAENYRISFIDSAGLPAKMSLPNFFPDKKDSSSFKKTVSIIEKKKTKKVATPSYGKVSMDTARQLAVMELNTFSHKKLPRFIRSGFKKLKQDNVDNLVIDLRSNGGGKIDNSTLLTRYIIDKPFRVADSVSAKDLRLAYPQYTQASWIYRYFRWSFSKKKEDGRWHMQQTERKVYKPLKKNHFDGNVYILTGGTTFSASLLFLSKVYQQENVTVVGEETGGGARGNSAVMIPKITLPNSKVQLRLPLFRLISDIHLPPNGRGIMPEVFARPGTWNIRENTDAKMEKVYALIAEKK
jgi:C-terminal processing protease CtpA/Prc